MQSRVRSALRLLEDANSTGSQSLGLGGYASYVRAASSQTRSSAGYSASPPLPAAENSSPALAAQCDPPFRSDGQESALSQLHAAAALIDALEHLVKFKSFARHGSHSAEPEALNFETRIESAPDYTREWLRTEFSEQVRRAKREGGMTHDLHAIAAVQEKKRSSTIAGFDISDELVRKGLKSAEVVEFLGTAGSLTFDALGFAQLEYIGRRGISILGVYLESQQGLVAKMKDAGNIQDAHDVTGFETAYLHFLTMIDQLYKRDAIYHGAAHAMDVMSTATWFMKSAEMMRTCSALDHFMVLVASAVHDVGHPGFNNLFLVKTMDPMAIRYNDKSCLENMHVAITFELMQKDRLSNWFGMLDNSGPCSGQKYMREGLISMVLATDMATHARYVAELDDIVKERAERPEGAAVDPKQLQKENTFLLDIVVHSSDIANPAKPRANMLAWTKRVNAEFWAQGDQERSKGLDISPLCDRATGRPALPKGQIGFISFVVMPFFSKIAKVLPEAEEAVDALNETLSFWKETEAAGRDFDEIFEGIEPSIKC
jgi:hypothetical protein